LPEAVDIYDTTLRDGSQQEGLSLTVDDKLRVAEQLDHLGVQYIEGGWPGANPTDAAFFARAASELKLRRATLTAFGMTRRAGTKAHEDKVLADLVAAQTSTVCIVAKSWDYHVTHALQTDLDEAVAMTADSVAFMRSEGRRVFLDAEHFFDGFKHNEEFALRVLRAAQEAGAEALVLCDTNGGTLPHEVDEIVNRVRPELSIQLGVHFHNDSGCAVANSLTAVRFGATHVQGCVNGYGERAGNADLVQAIPGLTLKLGVETIERERIKLLTPVAHHIAEVVNIAPNPQQPYAGERAFTHKAGLHASAIARARDAYEHLSPELVGNGTRVVVSDKGGMASMRMKAAEMSLELDDAALSRALELLKQLEHEGFHFEVADASLELLMRRASGWEQEFFEVESFRVITDDRQSGEAADAAMVTEATMRVRVGDQRVVRTAEGNGPVNALDQALRQAIIDRFPALGRVHLTDYKVRVLDTAKGTGAVTRVLIDSTDGERTWTTIGVSENIIDASWQAMFDAIVYALLHVEAS
jgi:2-isopropylmalate synthase